MRATRGRAAAAAPGTRRPVGEAPAEKIVTEAELRVKQLLEAQLDSSVTLSSLQARYKQFTPSLRYEPLLPTVSGTKSLATYTNAADGDQRLDDLRQLGLSEDDIRFKLANESSDGTVQQGCLAANPVVVRERLQRIDELLEAKNRARRSSSATAATFSGAATVSRHTLQLEHAIGHGKQLTSMASCLLRERHQRRRQQHGSQHSGSSSSDDADCADDSGQQLALAATSPADLLLAIAAELAPGSSRKRPRRHRQPGGSPPLDAGGASSKKKQRQQPDHLAGAGAGGTYGQPLPSADPCYDVPDCLPAQDEGRLHAAVVSELDALPSAAAEPAAGDDARRTPALSASSGNSRVLDEKQNVDDGPTPVCGPLLLVTDEYIEQNRLSLDQLRELPRFSGYEPGEPSNVLYLKNLSSNVRELDLVALFQRFSCPSKPRLIYRLLVGRMKGQAFVTFPDEGTATSALRVLNGFTFRGKPIVISYGRRNSAEMLSHSGQMASHSRPMEQQTAEPARTGPDHDQPKVEPSGPA